MRRPMICAALALAPILGARAQSAPPADSTLYSTVLIQAAPGKLTELLAVVHDHLAVHDAARQARPFIMRHSQGDHWDLMLLQPIGRSLTDWYAPARLAAHARAADASGLSDAAFEAKLRTLAAWREETIVRGPPVAALRDAFTANGYAHIEMFIALASQHSALRRQREMENGFLAVSGLPTNFIFEREAGAAWDLFTIGLYRDVKHYAEGTRLTPEQEEAAAHSAGFASRNDIGPFLRTLISSHHDTLAGVVR